MITATAFLAAAADAKLEDWGPLDEARGWTGTWQIHETIRKLYVLF